MFLIRFFISLSFGLLIVAVYLVFTSTPEFKFPVDLSEIDYEAFDDDLIDFKSNDLALHYWVEQYGQFSRIYVPSNKKMVDKLLWIDMDKRKNVVTLNVDQMQEENVDIDTTMLKGTFFKQKIQNMTVSMQGGIQFQTTDRNLKVIAPLFAEFDRKHGQIIYRAVDNSVTVQWKDLKLDHEDYLEDKFSFQATLFDDGKIEFVYKEVPSTLKPVNRGSKSLFLGFYGVAERNLDEILDENSKNKESNLEFDSDIGGHPIHVGTVIYLVPNPSCSAFTQCQQCSGRVISTSPFSASSCAWRPSTNTCVQSVKTSKNGFRFDTSMKPLTTARQECLDYEWGIVEWIIYSNSTLFLIALAGVFACMTFLFCFYLE